MILQPPSVLVMGAPGSGKTDSLATFLAAGLKLFVLSTEPDGVASLLDSCARRNLSIDNLHWATCLPATTGWSALESMALTIGTTGFEDIQKIKSGIGKSETRAPASRLLNLLKNFQCERTNVAYGDISLLGDDCAFALDSCSGLNIISWMLTLGYKPAAHQGEWGVAMNFVEQLLLKISSDRRCFFVLTAHVERELSELTGAQQIMVSTLGRKLAPKIPRFFSEVVYAKRTIRDGKGTFTWSTIDSQADLKNRALPIATDLAQDFKPIVAAYQRRKQLAQQSDEPIIDETRSVSFSEPAKVLPTAPLTPPRGVATTRS